MTDDSSMSPTVFQALRKLSYEQDVCKHRIETADVMEFMWMVPRVIAERYFRDHSNGWIGSYRGRECVGHIDDVPVLVGDYWTHAPQCILMVRWKFSTDIPEPCGYAFISPDPKGGDDE